MNYLYANKPLYRIWEAIRNVWRFIRNWIFGEVSPKEAKEDDDIGFDIMKHKEKPEGMSRQMILDLICDEFESGLRKLTTKHTLMFPFNYCIFLNPKDFSFFRQTFFKDAEDAAKELHERVDKIVSRDSRYRDFVPLSVCWQFQFLPFNDGQVLDDNGMDSKEMTSLPVGQGKVISTPLIEDLRVEREDSDGSTVITVLAKTTSNIQKIIINPDAMEGIDVVSKYCFRIDYNRHRPAQPRTPSFTAAPKHTVTKPAAQASTSSPSTVNPDSTIPPTRPESVSVGSGITASAPSFAPRSAVHTASLRIKINKFLNDAGELKDEYTMKTDYLKVAGQNSPTNDGGVPVVRINSERFLNPHITLRRDPSTGLYFITAHGDDVTLNNIQLSAGREEILHSPSTIAIGFAEIEFKAS